MTTETDIVVEMLKFLGPAGAASVITLYICKKYNGRKTGKSIFPCDFHKGLTEDINEIKEKVSDMPMKIIQIFKDLK